MLSIGLLFLVATSMMQCWLHSCCCGVQGRYHMVENYELSLSLLYTTVLNEAFTHMWRCVPARAYPRIASFFTAVDLLAFLSSACIMRVLRALRGLWLFASSRELLLLSCRGVDVSQLTGSFQQLFSILLILVGGACQTITSRHTPACLVHSYPNTYPIHNCPNTCLVHSYPNIYPIHSYTNTYLSPSSAHRGPPSQGANWPS
jgi:hypothetical protein